MIDVVLQLIIFFMYTAQYAQVTRTPLQLPDQPGDPAAQTTPTAIVIDLLPDGRFVVQRTPASLDRVLAMVRAEVQSLPSPDQLDLLLRAHRDAPAAHLNALATGLASIGVTHWKLATSQQSPGGTP